MTTMTASTAAADGKGSSNSSASGNDGVNVDPFKYQPGFGNSFESEARPGALPKGRNNPRQVPYQLYAEQLSGTSFTRPRHINQRTWLYRRQPSAIFNTVPFVLADISSSPSSPAASSSSSSSYFGHANPADGILDPNPLRWMPLEPQSKGTNDEKHHHCDDFVSGMHLMGASPSGGGPNGANDGSSGLAVYMYMFQNNMNDISKNYYNENDDDEAREGMKRYMYNSDGDFLIVPQQGTLNILTEVGRLRVGPGEICVIPRGIVFAVDGVTAKMDSTDGASGTKDIDMNRGYVLEIFGGHFTLPELGPIGSNGLANARDFMYPVAWFEDDEIDRRDGMELLNKFGSQVWAKQVRATSTSMTTTTTTTPFNVVAWHGNYLPFKYDLSKFCTVNSVSYDHLDPSIYTVLTCCGGWGGSSTSTPLCDFVIFPPRWMSTDANTFRPPWFHRNVMTEFMGLIHGGYDAKKAFLPGGASLHSCMTAHGPDTESYRRAVADPCLEPTYFSGGLAFMFETSCLLRLSKFALENKCLDSNYGKCWHNLTDSFDETTHDGTR